MSLFYAYIFNFIPVKPTMCSNLNTPFTDVLKMFRFSNCLSPFWPMARPFAPAPQIFFGYNQKLAITTSLWQYGDQPVTFDEHRKIIKTLLNDHLNRYESRGLQLLSRDTQLQNELSDKLLRKRRTLEEEQSRKRQDLFKFFRQDAKERQEQRDMLFERILQKNSELVPLQACLFQSMLHLLLLILLQFELQGQITEKLALQQNFNIRGALERIVLQARLKKIIWRPNGVQTGLDELAETPEFDKELDRVVGARKLVRGDVVHCVRHLYHEVSKHALRNDGFIILANAHHFDKNYRAAMVAFLRMQDKWVSPLDWVETRPPES
ncbi:unnamed protein product [Tuber aestivum]|uniref:Uncharacterized protein n=1 Tax=Tuber aestivum TaxID=59557 RepID=A0A292PK00_9PEZI|nr:unnamed protein product [Tuber aestivum]